MNYRYVLACIGGACLLGGCGGSSSTVPEPVKIVTKSIGPAGGTLSASASFSANFPAGAMTRETSVILDGFPSGIPGLAGPNWSVSDEPMRLRFDASALKADGTLRISMNLPRPKPASPGLYVLAMTGLDASGQPMGPIITLDEETSSDTAITGVVQRHELDELQGSQGFLFYAATRGGSQGTPFVSSVKRWDGNAFAAKANKLPNRRVAVVVHGVLSNLGDMQTLGKFLSGAKRGASSTPYYDSVIGFEYTSNAPIADIGKSLADKIKPLIANSSQVDVFAHSMGTLVSRYAIETPALTNRIGGKVSHFVSMGGPHAGVPFGDPTWYSTIMMFLPADAKPCLDDLMTVGKGGPPKTPFLTNLNPDTHSPDYARIKYYSMTGTNVNYMYNGYNIGTTVDYVYKQIVGSKVENDGLVAVYSGQDATLGKRSSSWVTGPSFDLTHAEIYSTKTAFDQLQTWLNGWNE